MQCLNELPSVANEWPSYEGLPPNFSLLQNMAAGAFAGIAVSDRRPRLVSRARTDSLTGAHGHVSSRCYQGQSGTWACRLARIIDFLVDSYANSQPNTLSHVQWNHTRRISDSHGRGFPQSVERHVKCDCRGRYVTAKLRSVRPSAAPRN